MFREETESERVDCRVARDDGRAINNHRKACEELYTRETASDDDAHRRPLLTNAVRFSLDCGQTAAIGGNARFAQTRENLIEK